MASFEQAVQLSARLGGRPLPAAGVGHVGVAEVLYEWNDLDGATQAVTRGLELLRGSVERGLLARGSIVLAQIRQAHGAGDAALEAIRRCEEWFAQSQLSVPGELALLAAYRARLWLRQGNLAAAEQWARERAAPAGLELELVQQLTLARLRLAQSDAGMPRLSEVNDTSDTLARRRS